MKGIPKSLLYDTACVECGVYKGIQRSARKINLTCIASLQHLSRTILFTLAAIGVEKQYTSSDSFKSLIS